MSVAGPVKTQAWHSGTNTSLAGPTKTMRQIKPQTFICGTPVKSSNLAICSTKILLLAGPAKTMSLAKWSSKISSAAGPVKTTNPICSTKILSLAGPAKTMNLAEWSSKIVWPDISMMGVNMRRVAGFDFHQIRKKYKVVSMPSMAIIAAAPEEQKAWMVLVGRTPYQPITSPWR